jgi:sugar transferase (PEP-CTERM/EpsH1 system associated)
MEANSLPAHKSIGTDARSVVSIEGFRAIMRILFLAHRLPYPPNKGDKIRSFAELSALSERHDVDLFCFYDQAEDRQYFDVVRQYCRNLYAEKISWLRSRAQALLALLLGRPFTSAFFHSPTMARRVQEALQTNDYDVVFVFSSSMAPYVESVSDIPIVLDMVDVDSDKWTQYAGSVQPPSSWLWRVEGERLAECEKRWAQDFSLTLLCTRAEAEILRARVPEAAIEAFENRVDLKYFDPTTAEVTPEIRGWQPYVVFTGSMDYFPNIDAVTFFHHEVFPAIQAKVPSAQFVIAGRSPTTAVRKLGHDPSVHVTGTVPDIRPYLLGAAAAVAPLRVARGVQNKILEAMAMGLPIGASQKVAMALPEDLIGAVHVEDDPLRLADFLVQTLLRSHSESRKTSAALLDYVDKIPWNDHLDALLLRVVRSFKIRRAGVSSAAPGSFEQRKIEGDIQQPDSMSRTSLPTLKKNSGSIRQGVEKAVDS